MAYNPYGFYNPYQQQPINPTELANQFAKQQQQYQNAYSQYQNAAQRKPDPTNAPVPAPAPAPKQLNSFNGIYVDSYEGVKSAPVAMDGTATICIGDGAFWIKKNVEGTITIDKRIYKEEVKEEPKSSNDLGERLAALESKMDLLIDKKEVKHNEKQPSTNVNVSKKSGTAKN